MSDSGWIRAYRTVLRIVPRGVRAEAGEEMEEVFAGALARTTSTTGRTILLARGVADAVVMAAWALGSRRGRGGWTRDLVKSTRPARSATRRLRRSWSC
ncbi:MAG: hypothetical protein GWM92_20400 [Gemmatimonadetes bacterium]|nr:hypothetical protein [Gemmatimonadota bacterium]NIR81197.1 hypothetical protein [Gemmatimonadota bacterium]NIT90042.1 hypothetical protein [Gemmatimonadota bacterium]NIU33851.1 hypothetical protein [Gemmatimonadota bacterium]NIU38048.1 hypothetical protein [Gemmatimonadota bacterium]